jgi:hypothetical protein
MPVTPRAPPPYERFDSLLQNSQEAWEALSTLPQPSALADLDQETNSHLSQPIGNDGPDFLTKLWLCPHRAIDFIEAQRLLPNLASETTSSGTFLLHGCGREFCEANCSTVLSWSHDDDGKKVYTLTTTIILLAAPTPAQAEDSASLNFTSDRIFAALRGLDFAVCPHQRLNHSFVRKRYFPNTAIAKTRKEPIRLYTYPLRDLPPFQGPMNVSSDSADACPACPLCYEESVSTTFAIGVERSNRSSKHVFLCLVFTRSLGTLRSPCDPSWLNHAISDKDFEQMKGTWMRWQSDIGKIRKSVVTQPLGVHSSTNSPGKDIPECTQSMQAHSSENELKLASSKCLGEQPAPILNLGRSRHDGLDLPPSKKPAHDSQYRPNPLCQMWRSLTSKWYAWKQVRQLRNDFVLPR